MLLSLTAETVERAALPLEGVDHVGGHDGLPPSVLCVGHRVSHDVLQEHTQHRPNLHKTLGTIMACVTRASILT